MTELERAAQQLLDMWDLGWIKPVSVVNTTALAQAMAELHVALGDVRMERINQEAHDRSRPS